jgi:hypothetical protein
MHCRAMDRAFDADWLRNDLMDRDIIPVIPPKSNRKVPHDVRQGNLQVATLDRKPLRQIEGKQEDSHVIVQNRPEIQSLHLDCSSNYPDPVNVNSP